MSEALHWIETTAPQSIHRKSFRLMRGSEWLGTVWDSVCGFSWARIGVASGPIGGACDSIADGQRQLLAFIGAAI